MMYVHQGLLAMLPLIVVTNVSNHASPVSLILLTALSVLRDIICIMAIAL
jgi:hypothetical protein